MSKVKASHKPRTIKLNQQQAASLLYQAVIAGDR